MLIKVGAFEGVAPKAEPRNLPDGYAVKAVNTKLWNGSLRPYRGPLAVTTLAKVGIKRSIYRFGRGRPESEWWMHWTDPTNVVRSPIASQNNERTYWSGEGGLRVTDATMVASGGGTQYPVVSRPVGVPTPATPPGASVLGTPAANATVADRYFVYTFVNEWGEEGPPSPPSNVASATTTQTVQLTALDVPSGQWAFSAKRIYMSNGTGATANFYYLTEIPPGQTTVVVTANVVNAIEGSSTEGAIALGEPIMSTSWLPPPPDIHSLRQLPSGVLVGLSDMSVIFCEPGYPYAWPPEYGLSLEHTPIACAVFDQATVVVTDAFPYIIQGTIPGQMTQRKLETEQACVSPRSVVQAGGAVAYASPDGFVMIDSSGVQVATDPFFDRDQWQALDPASMFAVWWDRRYVIFLGGRKGCLLMEADKPPVFCDVWADSAYVDPESDTLYIARTNELMKFDAGDDLMFTWESKEYETTFPANFSAALVSGNEVEAELRVWCDDVLRGVIPIRVNEPMRLPAGFAGYGHRFEIRGRGRVMRLKIAQSMRELKAG